MCVVVSSNWIRSNKLAQTNIKNFRKFNKKGNYRNKIILREKCSSCEITFYVDTFNSWRLYCHTKPLILFCYLRAWQNWLSSAAWTQNLGWALSSKEHTLYLSFFGSNQPKPYLHLNLGLVYRRCKCGTISF